MHTTLSACIAAIVAAVLSTAPAEAQNNRSFVALTGNDLNTCAIESSPCRTMTGALGKTIAGGIIYCLDSGEFSGGGTTTSINKSITIDCAGTGGSIHVIGASVHAITVAASTTDVIHIRGLKLFSNGGSVLSFASTGVAASVRVEGCDLVGNGGNVVSMGNTASTNVLELFLVNTTISKASTGITLIPNGGAVKLMLDNVRISNNSGNGIFLNGITATTAPGLRVMVKNSTISGNNGAGIIAQSFNGTTRVFVEDSVIAQNGVYGLQVNGPLADFIVSRSTIIQNDVGLIASSGGRLFSYGNNGIHGNLNGNGAFTGIIPLQ